MSGVPLKMVNLPLLFHTFVFSLMVVNAVAMFKDQMIFYKEITCTIFFFQLYTGPVLGPPIVHYMMLLKKKYTKRNTHN